MADLRAHPLDLALAALAQRDLQDAGLELAHLGRRGHAVVELDALAQRAQRLLGHRDAAAADVGDVDLRDLVARVREAVGEVAVVGQQDQAGGVGVEAADRVEPRAGRVDELDDGRAAVGVLGGRDDAARLVDQPDRALLGAP